MKYPIQILTVGCLVACFAGCRNPSPLWAPPGPIQQQRNNASFHDPYSDVDAGPEVVGARPREFQKPNPEPVRDRWFTDHVLGR